MTNWMYWNHKASVYPAAFMTAYLVVYFTLSVLHSPPMPTAIWKPAMRESPSYCDASARINAPIFVWNVLFQYCGTMVPLPPVIFCTPELKTQSGVPCLLYGRCHELLF